ncbi:MAG TPA: TPM domain-containing protein [Sphingomonadaceae bacterium]|nr:TPM domain-containing protein [Sphingomonadaceae bacterium]
MLVFAAPAAAQPQFPELTGRVVDAANIIPDDTEAQLAAKLEALETQSQRQLVVATVPDLQGYEISDYGYQLGRHWGLGDAERNDGIMLLVAPNERKVRIEVGYGLEPIVTDGLSHLIINQQIVPRFKEGDMPGGIVAGTDALIAQLQLPPDEAQRIAAEAGQNQGSDDARNAIGGTIFFIMFLLFFVIPIIAATRGGKRRRGSGVGEAVANIILWEAMKAATGGHKGSSGWGGGGFGGGGGFSGGGGSFGGGGASGSW